MVCEINISLRLRKGGTSKTQTDEAIKLIGFLPDSWFNSARSVKETIFEPLMDFRLRGDSEELNFR